MVKLFLFATLLALAAAHDFKPCGTENLGVSAVVVTPDSPIPGQNLTVALSVTPTQDLVEGDVLTITIKATTTHLTRLTLHDRCLA